jgi:hypothetical protein
MKNLLKIAVAVAFFVTVGFAAQAQETGVKIKDATQAQSVKGGKAKDRSTASTDETRTKPLADQPGTGLKTETERPVSTGAMPPSTDAKQSTKTSTERGEAKDVQKAKAKKHHTKSHVPRGKAHGWHRNKGTAQPRSR